MSKRKFVNIRSRKKKTLFLSLLACLFLLGIGYANIETLLGINGTIVVSRFYNYTISYTLDGGNVSNANPTNYSKLTPTFTLNNPTKDGYIFIGWTGSNGTTPQTSVEITNGSTGDKSYTANWEPIIYDLEYDFNEANNLNYWFVFEIENHFITERFHLSYNSTNKMNSINILSDFGWEILYIPINTIANKAYEITFDYINPNTYSPLNNYIGLGVQALTTITNGSNRENALNSVYLSPSGNPNKQTITLSFVATSNTTYLAINCGYIGDGQNVTFQLGNFKMKDSIAFSQEISTMPQLNLDCSFSGWYDEASGGNRINVFTMPSHNTTLYAHISSNNRFDYTGREQTFTIPKTGYYKLETWGAQGGYGAWGSSPNKYGGYGGYAVGVAYLAQGTTLYINIGQKGQQYSGGYNGGGNGSYSRVDEYSGGGGGATHIATRSGLLSTFSNSISNLLIVAGGGGGGSTCSSEDTDTIIGGGSGGGYIGGSNYRNLSTGGSSSSSGVINSGFGNRGSFGKGGDGYISGTRCESSGGGGGGYYGGVSSNYGGTGGSGYIANGTLSNKYMVCYNCTNSSDIATKTYSSTCASRTATKDCAKTDNGYVKITYVGE